MTAAAAPLPDAPLDAKTRRELLVRRGDGIRPRLLALALALGVPIDRAEENAQRVLFEFLDGGRSPQIDPANEHESLTVHLLGAMRSALDTRTREFRGRVKTTT